MLWNISRKDLVLISVITLVLLLLMEIIARVIIYSNFAPPRYLLPSELAKTEQIAITPHHYLNYFSRPNFENSNMHGNLGITRHNSLGFRGAEFSFKKPKDVYRIVALGGSTTYTDKVQDDNKTFPVQLQNILRNQYGHRNVEVINAGVGGYNTWETLINLQYRVLDLEPNLVIIYHAHNDIHARLVEPSAYKGDNSGRRKQWGWKPPWWSHSALLRLIIIKAGLGQMPGVGNLVNADTYMGLGSNAFKQMDDERLLDLLDKNPPYFFRRNLEYIIAAARVSGTQIMFATFAYSPEMPEATTAREAYYRGTREHNEIIAAVADQHQVPVLDFATLMPGSAKYWSDQVHVNESGALVKAQIFAQFINDTLL